MTDYLLDIKGVTATTDADGNVIIPIVAPKSYLLSFFAPRSSPGTMTIPRGQPGDKIICINQITGDGGAIAVGQDFTNMFETYLDSDGKIVQTFSYSASAPTSWLALLERNS